MTENRSSTEPPVLVEKFEGDRIWVITMNRPHRLNALSGELVSQLHKTFENYRDDPVARVAILTGAGERAFCAGADLKEEKDIQAAKPTSASPNRARSRRLPLVPLSENLELWKPTIAAINGLAIAGGFMMAMQCDIRIMAQEAKAGISEVKWNMGGGGWMTPLTRQIGLGNALELVLWGDYQMTAQRALEIGWAQRVVPAAELMPTAMSYAHRMLALAPRAVENKKELLYRGFHMDPPATMTLGYWLEQNLAGMKDSVEGLAAFAEKRPPNFTNE
jgi:enoyl-CoA hydratase/carnithine racemase